MMASLQVVAATIAAGETLSDVVDMTTKSLVMIVMPGEWTQSGGLTFQVSVDGTDFHDLFHSTTGEVFLTVSPGSAVIVPKEIGDSFNFLKLRSGPSRQPVPQPADRQFTLAVSQ